MSYQQSLPLARATPPHERLELKQLADNELVCLRVSGFREEDAPSLVRSADNPNIAKRLRGVFPHPYKAEDAEFWIQFTRLGEKWEEVQLPDGKPFALPIVIVEDAAGASEAVIGSIALSPLTPETAAAISSSVAAPARGVCWELGYWLAEDFWGKGIGNCMIHAFVDLCFRRFSSLTSIAAFPSATNPASQKALIAAGFVRLDAEPVVEKSHPVCKTLGLPEEVTMDQFLLERPGASAERRFARDAEI
jgi:RimJ/RimL family protein N-acetyltransferase